MKFCFRVGKCKKIEHLLALFDDVFEGINKEELNHFLRSQRSGSQMHLIIRPRPGFNVEAKRNYFHGPVLSWICRTLQDRGIPAAREPMREELKRMFIGEDEQGRPLSARTLEIKTEGDPRDPETKYGDFLRDVKLWCIDNLGSAPPPPDTVDYED